MQRRKTTELGADPHRKDHRSRSRGEQVTGPSRNYLQSRTILAYRSSTAWLLTHCEPKKGGSPDPGSSVLPQRLEPLEPLGA